jgi:hypothetical protein
MNGILAEFRAPWGRVLKVASLLAGALLLGIPIIGLWAGPRHLWIWNAAMVAIPPLLLLSALPFMVLGYSLTERTLEIKRPGRVTVLPLKGLISAGGDAEAFRGALRLFGNGGLFGITGWFWSRKLGRFRAFATDPSRSVVLRYADRKIVVTPHDPQHFIVRVRTLARLA